jgi:sporulation protein YlmC with PRC-barrel domain
MSIGEKVSRLAHLSDARRWRIPRLVLALSICGGLASVANVAHADVLVVDVVAVADGVRVNEIKGKAVYNEANERIGSLDDLIIGRDRVLFAILQDGGFLGLGRHYVAVPYEALQFAGGASPKTILPGATKQELKSLPEFEYRK